MAAFYECNHSTGCAANLCHGHSDAGRNGRSRQNRPQRSSDENRQAVNKVAFRVGLCLIAFCILTSLLIRYHRSDLDRAGSAQAASVFLDALSKGDLDTARLRSWGDVMHATLQPPAFESFRDATIMEVVDIKRTSSESRPAYYRKLHKMMSAEIRIKTIRQDDSGNPPGEYTMFVLTVQPTQEDDWAVAEIGSAP